MHLHLGRKEAPYEGYYIPCASLGMRLSEEPDATPKPIVEEWLQAHAIGGI